MNKNGITLQKLQSFPQQFLDIGLGIFDISKIFVVMSIFNKSNILDYNAVVNAKTYISYAKTLLPNDCSTMPSVGGTRKKTSKS